MNPEKPQCPRTRSEGLARFSTVGRTERARTRVQSPQLTEQLHRPYFCFDSPAVLSFEVNSPSSWKEGARSRTRRTSTTPRARMCSGRQFATDFIVLAAAGVWRRSSLYFLSLSSQSPLPLHRRTCPHGPVTVGSTRICRRPGVSPTLLRRSGCSGRWSLQQHVILFPCANSKLAAAIYG